jgi:Zn-finger protein
MKKIIKLFGIIALAAVIGFSMIACGDDGSPSGGGGGGGGGSNGSIDGVWRCETPGYVHTINGSSGAVTQIYPSNRLHTDALNKGYLSINGPVYRNLTSTGNLTWSGQYLSVKYNSNSPNIALGNEWVDCTLTLSANGQTLQFYSGGVTENPNRTYTRGNYSIDGVWRCENPGYIHTISGSSGVVTQIFSSNRLHTDALNKGYLSINGQVYRNLTSSGN